MSQTTTSTRRPTTPGVPVAAPATTTLEAPEKPPLPMTRTPKQRADVKKVAEMLRGQRAEAAENAAIDAASEEEDETEVDPDDPADAPQEPTKEGLNEFGPPDWFHMPLDGLPGDVKPGTTVIFLRFPVWVTGDPQKGERQCACRPLTVKGEQYARSRAFGKTNFELVEEYTKAMICVVDGRRASFFEKGEGNVSHFWAEIGPKARDMLMVVHTRLNRMNEKERASFLGSCMTARTVA